jgi:hypothetical protein
MQGMDVVFHLAALITIPFSYHSPDSYVDPTSKAHGMCFRRCGIQINPAAKVASEEIRRRPEKSDVERLLGSNEKIRRLTGWQPACTLKQSIRETIEWFRNQGTLRHYKWNVYNV